jgi:hypothetical protein
MNVILYNKVKHLFPEQIVIDISTVKNVESYSDIIEKYIKNNNFIIIVSETLLSTSFIKKMNSINKSNFKNFIFYLDDYIGIDTIHNLTRNDIKIEECYYLQYNNTVCFECCEKKCEIKINNYNKCIYCPYCIHY